MKRECKLFCVNPKDWLRISWLGYSNIIVHCVYRFLHKRIRLSTGSLIRLYMVKGLFQIGWWYSVSKIYHKLIESLSPVPGTSSPFLGDICHSQIYAFEQGIICWKYCFWLCKKVNSTVELNSIVTIYNISSISYATASLEIIQTRFAVGIWNFIMLYPCWLSKNPFSPSPLAFIL